MSKLSGSLLLLFAALVCVSASAVAQDDTPSTTEDVAADSATSEQVAAGSEEASETDETESVSQDLDLGPSYDKGDVAWMLVSIAFVLMMTCPGLALFYGGLVRKKNILSVMMQCMFLMGLMSVLWAVVGYSLAFATPLIPGFDIIGGFDHVLLKGVSPSAEATVEDLTMDQITVAFQGMFFIITPGLICGAFAERMKFSTMAVFSVLWGLLIYCPIAHWVWSGTGWLSEFNGTAKALHDAGKDAGFYHPAIDFAGGLVVHISSGVSALVIAILIGKRRGFPTQPMPPHNLTYTCIGTGLLWVGWFGFNGGSQVAADGRAVNAVLATHLAASAGLLSWSLAEIFKHGKASILGACSGAVAGLVCITPAAGSVTPVSGIIMGFIAGIFCFLCCTSLKNALGYDDSLDAFGIHGMGGILGALLTGVFATSVVTGDVNSTGILDGNPGQMTNQIISVVAAVGFSSVGTFILVKVLDGAMGLRVTEEEETQGLDLSQHGEDGYIFQ